MAAGGPVPSGGPCRVHRSLGLGGPLSRVCWACRFKIIIILNIAGFLFFCLVSRWVEWFLGALSVAPGAGVRLVRAQPGERARPAPAEKSVLPRGGCRDCCAGGGGGGCVCSSPRLSLSPGSRPRRRRQNPGTRAPRLAPKFPHRLQTTLLFAEVCVLHPRDAGAQRLAPRLPDRPGRRTGGEGAFCPGRGKPAGWWRRGLAEWGAPAWLCTWREGPSGTGTLVESHFCQSLIGKPVGVSFPAGSFSCWGRDEGGQDTQSPGRALGLRCSKGLLGHPPAPHPRPQTWGTMLVARDRAAERGGVARAGLLGSLAPGSPLKPGSLHLTAGVH